MKRIHLLFSILLAGVFLACTIITSQPTEVNFIKTDPYKESWKKVEELQQQGLPQSAKEAVEKILTEVREKKDIDQIIRCHLYIARYTQELNEEGAKKGIQFLEEELDRANGLEKGMLYSILGEAYTQYLNSNRWNINQRTELVEAKADMLTWTTNQFIEKSKEYYLKSLEQGDWLKLPISELEFILTEGRATEELRPTVFDFLAHRAIDHFSNTRNLITEPTNSFLLNDEKVFGSTRDFLNLTFQTENESSGVYQALLIIQQLAQHHQSIGNKKALLDIERKRLVFAKSNAVLANKEELFLKRLQQFVDENKAEQNCGDFLYEITNFHFNKANSSAFDYEARDPDAFLQARKKAKECISAYPDSWGAEQCRSILVQLAQKELNIQVEQAIPSNQDFLVGLTFRNINKFHIKLIEANEDMISQLNRSNTREQIAILNNGKAMKSWSIDLDFKEDLYQHRSEFSVDGLALGEYLIVVSEGEKLKESEHFKRSIFRITNLSLITFNGRGNPQELIVANRQSGEAINGAKVEQWTTKRVARKQSEIKVTEKQTDSNGKVSFNVSRNQSYFYKIYNGQDFYQPNERFYGSDNSNNRNSYSSITFFLDRKIYRPGQTIFYKGIAMDFDSSRKPKIIPNKKYIIKLHDANRQEIGKQTVVTNEYGSFQGSFIAPEGGLLGRHSIKSGAGNGQVAFNVEEYKRPKFEVEFNAPEAETALNQTIELKGTAKAFAGYPIDQAKVNYRVTRQAFFPWCPWWRIPSHYNRAQAEIANGILKTDEQGNFTVTFLAKPDLTILESDQPEYNYAITADVTDGTGETRSTSYSIRAGVVGFNLSHDLKPVLNKEELKQINIYSKNLNGQFVSVELEAKLLKLEKPQEVFKKRYYSMPDVYLMNRADFKKKFPRFAFEEEAKTHTWKTEKEVWADKWKTEEGEAKDLSKANLEAGTYKLLLSGTDRFGKKAEQESIVEIFDETEKKLPGTNWLWSQSDEKNYKVGEQLALVLAAKEKTNIYFQFYRNSQVLDEGWTSADLKTQLNRTITEADKGNIFLNFAYIKENRLFIENKTILVPWSDKILNIETSTFRDKLRPGDDETWSFKISGEEKDKFAAEVLATMYDASLDAFMENKFGMNVWPSNYSQKNVRGFGFSNAGDRGNHPRVEYYQPKINRTFPGLNSFGLYWSDHRVVAAEMMDMEGAPRMKSASRANSSFPIKAKSAPMGGALKETMEMDMDDTAAQSTYGNSISNENTEEAPPKDPVRTNLNETVFFLPQLQTDEAGDLSFSFKMNEALTSWKLMLQAHDKELRTGTLTKEIVTQKELMVVPNPPRFFREGDLIEFTAKVVNLTENAMTGSVKLSLANALTEETINHLISENNELPIELGPNASTSVSWKLNIPKSYLPAITHKVVATAGKFSDGEQEDRVVLTNRLMVTETFPMPVRANEKRTFDFSRIKEVQNSTSAVPHQYSVEFTSNPAWYAVLALPYLMEYPYDCNEQIFSRYYANTIAAGIANKYPKIKSVFQQWENTDALLSNLSKNEDLKSALLEETPWVLQSQSEEEQRKNIGLLFNLEKLGREQNKAINKLKNRQEGDGGFAWFKGGRSSPYITEYILTGFKRLEKMGFATDDRAVEQILSKGLEFIDYTFAEDFEKLKQRLHRNNEKLDPEKQYLNHRTIHYLFARSFFTKDIPNNSREAYDFYQKQVEKFWTKFGLQNQAQIALILNRTDRREKSLAILKSFRERALHHDELGMYWKVNRGYFWYNNELESHAFLINCLQEIDPQQRELEDLQTWLLKNKQTNAWETTKSTAMAIYALLMTGEKPGASLANSQLVDITLGNEPLKIENTEAGTGYFRINYDGDEIPAGASNVTVQNPNDGIAWGASYFQYFEDMDKVTNFEETPLQLKKEVMLETMTPDGPVLKNLNGVDLKPGDRLKVRIEIRVDRAMEFVHMKDQRASGLEPENVISSYKYQGALGYYESTKDASTNFFIGYLPVGTHVFEYPLRVVHEGDFSNGITTIQSMYAPEFSSHSEGIRIKVGD